MDEEPTNNEDQNKKRREEEKDVDVDVSEILHQVGAIRH